MVKISNTMNEKAKYAILKIKGNQYKVSEGEEILVKHLSQKEVPYEALLLADGENVTIGKPSIKNVKVTLKIVSPEEKGEKIRVLKFKAKSRYRRRIGFRPKYTRLLVEKIS